jgi:L-Ala-D/L-Glu epimerase
MWGISKSIEILKLAHQNSLAYQLGAQVAEIGPLIAASRHLAYAVKGYFAYEGGQADRYFKEFIVHPIPLVDRKTNLAAPIQGNGLGLELNQNYQHLIQKRINI